MYSSCRLSSPLLQCPTQEDLYLTQACSRSLSQFLIKVLSGSFPPLPVTGSQGLEQAQQRLHYGATSLALQPVFISKETKG